METAWVLERTSERQQPQVFVDLLKS